MTSRAAAAVLLAIVTSAAGGGTRGEDVVHTVAAGESASAIAERYFGDFAHAELLLRFNDRSGATIHPGERLVVPVSPVHRVERGDTGSMLADRYLGRASAWPVVAELNGLVPEAPLRLGRTLTMPAVARHRIRRGESLTVLARRYYGTSSRAALLREYNRIADPRDLAVGQVVEIPLVAPPLVASRADGPAVDPAGDAVAAAEPAPAPAEPVAEVEPPAPAGPPAWFTDDLASAERAFRSGEFDLASDLVAGAAARLDEVPDPADRGRLWSLAAFVHVAFDRDEAACAAFDAARDELGHLELDPERVSPKIRDSLAACPRDEPTRR